MGNLELLKAVEQFNQQEFYACHDTLEALWLDAPESDRRFYQGLLQIAVSCYHLGNGNWQGAVTLLGEGTRRLQDYQPEFEGIDIIQLLGASLDLLETLQQTPSDRTLAQKLAKESDRGFPKIVFLG